MSFWRNFYHLIWCTKDRVPLIHADIEQQLYRYLIKKAAEQDIFIYEINGIDDHLHIIASIPPKHCVADVVDYSPERPLFPSPPSHFNLIPHLLQYPGDLLTVIPLDFDNLFLDRPATAAGSF